MRRVEIRIVCPAGIWYSITILTIPISKNLKGAAYLKKPGSSEELRRTNLRRIFECIRLNGAMTKMQIQSATGLSWGSVSALCADLLEWEILWEEKAPQATAGRTPTCLMINGKRHLTIGLDASFDHMTAVITDLAGHMLHCETQPVPDRSGTQILSDMRAITRSILKQVPQNSVAGIAVSLPGHMDAIRRGSVWAHLFGNFESVGLSGILEEEFGVPVLLCHDPDSMASAEHLLGAARDINDFLYIQLSLGIGMGIMSGGQIYRGKNGAAGELGHMTMNPRGERCHCGNYGCLETFSSVESILRRCTEAVYAGKAPLLRRHLDSGGQLTLANAAEAARSGDTAIKNIFLKAAHYAGIAVANAVNLMDPDAVVLGGELSGYRDIFLDRLTDTVKSHVWSGKIDLRIAQLGSNAAAIGAASLLVPQVFSQLIE